MIHLAAPDVTIDDGYAARERMIARARATDGYAYLVRCMICGAPFGTSTGRETCMLCDPPCAAARAACDLAPTT